MPQFDRTGPKGEGSQTGRGMGKCNPNNKTDMPETNAPRGRGLGRKQEQNFGSGQGRGAGMGRGFGEGKGMGRGRTQ